MKLIRDFHMWVLGLRRSGTTTLLEKIAKEYDVYILVPSSEEKKDPKWNGKAISFDDLKNDGVEPKPLFLDNHAMLKFSELAYNYSQKLEKELKDRNGLLQKIKTDLINFEDKNAPFDGSERKSKFYF